MDIRRTCCICNSGTKKVFNIGKVNEENEKIKGALREVLDIHNIPRNTSMCLECSKALLSYSNFKLVALNNLGVYVAKLLGRDVPKDTLLNFEPETVSLEETKTVSYMDMYSKSDYDYINIFPHSKTGSDLENTCEDFCEQQILKKDTVKTKNRRKNTPKKCFENVVSLNRNTQPTEISKDIFTGESSTKEGTSNIGTTFDENTPKSIPKQKTCLRMNSSNEVMFSSSGNYNESDSDVQYIEDSHEKNNFSIEPAILKSDLTDSSNTEFLDSLTKSTNPKNIPENTNRRNISSFNFGNFLKEEFKNFSSLNYENVTPEYFIKYVPLTISKFTPFKAENDNLKTQASNLVNTEGNTENNNAQNPSDLKERMKALFPTLKFKFDDEENKNENLDTKNKNLSKTKQNIKENKNETPLKRNASLYSRNNNPLSKNLNNKENLNTSNTTELVVNPFHKKSKFKCKICKNVFTTKSECNTHTKSHIPKNFCYYCQEQFSSRYLLTLHKRENDHKYLKKFQCILCDEIYETADAIITHYVNLKCITEKC